MAKRKQDVKVNQAITVEATELFQPLSDQQAETVKGGHTYQYNDYCNRTNKIMVKTARA